MTPNQARAHIDNQRMIDALNGDDEDTVQFRNVVVAAQSIVEELGQKRASLFESGHYTEDGMGEVMKAPATEAATKLSNLQSSILVPRMSRLESELAKLPEPTTGKPLGEMEQHRLVSAYCEASGDRKIEMRAEAIRNPKLAKALVNEDPAVTGLSPKFISELRGKITSDPHTTERSALQRKLNAAKAAQTALNGANISVRRAIEVAQ
jgi:hypothetical protein